MLYYDDEDEYDTSNSGGVVDLAFLALIVVFLFTAFISWFGAWTCYKTRRFWKVINKPINVIATAFFNLGNLTFSL
ncbi:hypothetical protein FA947_00295 [Mycoplasmoides pneumoniae]|nr:hypothetical protein C985_00730 [Mycoplasmoides pneumoniae M129-B7]ALA30898.1 hypothetical protein B434_01810 [Mycoplasmoides pneumoniae 19294]ALA32044.1 hypothetical protein F533_00295 [Mycoplasmoides pneumoniae 51494]ALA32747.1 hypothetical protein F530_00295 [Mycoplasmoides pneumoniae 54089]ALA33450.1 hypothetical protein F531_00295 [Mycoplasmoides pneumoniae 54524]ALA34863.1 hypothetical protein F535_00295 [Mycoplasmoides pneumoniae 85138]ALA36272.1 hypothetical protein F538_00290 [Myc